MYQALLERQVDAVLFGAPPLRYFSAHEGAGRVKVVGAEVQQARCRFVFRLGDPLRRKVSTALIMLREDGTYQELEREMVRQ